MTITVKQYSVFMKSRYGRPFRYGLFCLKKNAFIDQRDTPYLLRELMTYETIDERTKKLEQTRECSEDERFFARLRLFEWQTKGRYGVKDFGLSKKQVKEWQAKYSIYAD